MLKNLLAQNYSGDSPALWHKRKTNGTFRKVGNIF